MSKVYYPGDEPVPGYRLGRFLGRGSIGEVWKAEGQGGLEVALKLSNLENRPGIRDLRVLASLKKIRHPQLVPLLAYWLKNDDGKLLTDSTFDMSTRELTATTRPMEMILALGLGDRNLRDRMVDCQSKQLGGIPVDELLGYMAEAAKGIDFLNQPIHDFGQGDRQPIYHCNIKPQNLIQVGNSVQIADYGLAHLLDAHLSTITAFSLTYVAPEVVKDNKPGPHTDQYALAVTYYELRTGQNTCSSKLMLDIYTQKLGGKLDFSHVPDREQEVLRRATAIDPAKRFTSTVEFVEQLRRAIAPAPLAMPPVPPEAAKTSPLTDAASTSNPFPARGTTSVAPPSASGVSAPPKPRSSQTGLEVVPGYRLLQLLGRGGYGEVWSATAPGGMKVAVKIIRNLDTDASQQEFRALELIKGVSHNHLLELHAAWLLDMNGHIIDDEEYGQPGVPIAATLVIACRLAQKNLAQRLKECVAAGQTGIPLKELLPFLMQAALAIDHLNMPVHKMGSKIVAIQHRDIKPENLLLVDQQTLKVADFGLAKMLEAATGTVQTSAPAMTLAYAAPELFDGQVTPHTDQYSLAITWYQLRTGHLPFPPVTTQQQYILLHMNGKLDFQRVPPEEQAVLRKATARQSVDRFPTCVRFAQMLGQATGIPVHVPALATAEGEPEPAPAPGLASFSSLSPMGTAFPSLDEDIYAQGQVPSTPTDHPLDTQHASPLTAATAQQQVPPPVPSLESRPLQALHMPNPFATQLPGEEPEALYEETIPPIQAPLRGEPFYSEMPYEAPSAPPVPTPVVKRGKSGLLLGIAICFIAGLGAVAGMWWFFQNYKWAPRAQVEQLIAEKNYPAAWDELARGTFTPHETEELQNTVLQAWWQQIDEEAKAGRIAQAFNMSEAMLARVRGHAEGESRTRERRSALDEKIKQATHDIWLDLSKGNDALEKEPAQAMEHYRRAEAGAKRLSERHHYRFPAVLGQARAIARLQRWAELRALVALAMGLPDFYSTTSLNRFLLEALSLLAQSDAVNASDALAQARVLLKDRAEANTWEMKQVQERFPSLLLRRAEELVASDSVEAGRLLDEAEKLSLDQKGKAQVAQIRQKLKPNAQYDPQRWQEAVAAADKGDYSRALELCKDLKAAPTTPTNLKPALEALETECQGVLEDAANQTEEAVKRLATLEVKSPERSKARRVRIRDVFVKCIQNNRHSDREWLTPYDAPAKATQALAWATKAEEWDGENALPLEVRVARALAAWHQDKRDARLVLTLTGPLLQMESLSPVDRCALLFVRAQAAMEAGPTEDSAMALDAFAQLCMGLGQKPDLRPAFDLYRSKVFTPALSLRQKLPADAAATRGALAAIYAEQGQALLDDPPAMLKEEQGQLCWDSFDQAVQLDPSQPAYLVGRARACEGRATPDWKAMEADARQALGLDAKRPFAHWALATALHKQVLAEPNRTRRVERLRDVINGYGEAIKLIDPQPDREREQARFRVDRSAAYILLANWSDDPKPDRKQMLLQAVADAQAATKATAYPHPEHAWGALGYALEDVAELHPDTDFHQFAEAVEAMTKALSINRTESKYWLARGRCLVKAVIRPTTPHGPTDFKQALEDLRTALTCRDGTPERRFHAECHYWLATIHAVQKDFAQAEQQFQQADKLWKANTRDWVVHQIHWAALKLDHARHLFEQRAEDPRILRLLGEARQRLDLLQDAAFSEAENANLLRRRADGQEIAFHLEDYKRLEERQQSAAAAVVMKKLLQLVERLDPANGLDAAQWKGRVLFYANRFEDAQRAIDSALPANLSDLRKEHLPLLADCCYVQVELVRRKPERARLEQLLKAAARLGELAPDEPQRQAEAQGLAGDAYFYLFTLPNLSKEDKASYAAKCRAAYRKALTYDARLPDGYRWRFNLATFIGAQLQEETDQAKRKPLLEEGKRLLEEALEGKHSRKPPPTARNLIEQWLKDFNNALNQS
jgi:serine/threonine protein kinase